MRIGLVGCGRWGRNILRDLVALGCQVGVVARSDSSRAAARSGGAAEVWDAMDRMGEVDGIIVATPTSTHAAVVEAVLDRGVPVFCEKPLGIELEPLQLLVSRAGDRLFVMEKWRYHPGVEEIGRIHRSGELGPLGLLNVTFTSWGRRHSDVDGIWVVLPHVVSIIREIVGTVPSVLAASGTRVESGDVALVAHIGDDPASVAVLSTLDPIYRRTVTGYFEHGVVHLADGYDQHLSVVHYGSSIESLEKRLLPPEMPLFMEVTAFITHLRGGPPPRSSAQEGLESVETIAAIRGKLNW